MKTLSQFRDENTPRLTTSNGISLNIAILMKKQLDFEVFLPTYNRNLQRDFCWNIHQKQEIIMSLLLRKLIPPITCIIYDCDRKTHLYQIIDGKQRLMSIISFVNYEFPIIIDGESYLFNDLDESYQLSITRNFLTFNILYDDNGNIKDDDKLALFKFVNYSGTLMDKDYMDSFVKNDNI